MQRCIQDSFVHYRLARLSGKRKGLGARRKWETELYGVDRLATDENADAETSHNDEKKWNTIHHCFSLFAFLFPYCVRMTLLLRHRLPAIAIVYPYPSPRNLNSPRKPHHPALNHPPSSQPPIPTLLKSQIKCPSNSPHPPTSQTPRSILLPRCDASALFASVPSKQRSRSSNGGIPHSA